MAADDQISVELIAKIDNLTQGLAEASAAVKAAGEQMTGGMKATGEAAKETDSLLKTVLSGAAFLEFKEIATEALHMVQEAFEMTVGRAEEFGLASAKFAALMGTSDAEAAGLAAALRGVGSSAESYQGIALRMEMRLRTNEKALTDLGVATRGASGELLSGKGLMDSAIATLRSYKTGTDQNEAALAIFGRRAAEIFDIMRVGDEQVQNQIAIYKEFGVNLDGTGSSSAELEEQLNNLHTSVDALELSLGQKLLPTATRLIEVMGEAAPVFEALGAVMKALITVAGAIGEAFIGAGGIIYGVVVELFDVLKGLGQVVIDALTGHWAALGGDVKAAWGEMKDDLSSTLGVMGDSWIAYTDLVKKLWSDGKSDAEKNPYKPPGGTKSFSAPTKDKTTGAKLEDEEIKSEEKLAEAKIAIEEKTNLHLYAMGQESLDQELAQETTLENEKFAVKNTALGKELALHAKNKVERQKILDEILLLQVTHEGKLLEIQQKGDEKRAEIARQAAQDAQALADEKLTEGKKKLDEELAAEQISARQRYDQEVALTRSVREEELKRLDALMATLAQGTKAWEEAHKERQKVSKDFTAEVTKLNEQLTADTKKQVQGWTQPMVSGFSTAMSDMLIHGKSFADSMKALGDTMLQGFVSMLAQMAEKWLTTQITNAIVGTTEQQAMTTAQSTIQAEGAAAQLAIDKATAISAIAASAGVAGAAAFAANVGIPIVGPAVAAGAAADAVASVLAFESLALAAGGMVVDRDQLIFAHKDEHVLPANLARGYQSIINSASTSSSTKGGDTNLHYAPTINAPANKSLAQLLDQESRTMLDWISARSRDGSLRGRI